MPSWSALVKMWRQGVPSDIRHREKEQVNPGRRNQKLPRVPWPHPTSLTSTLLGSSSTYFFSSNTLSMMGPRMPCR